MTQYTPNLNLPYPEAAEMPEGDVQMQALAEAVDGQAGPARQTDIVYSSGYQADGVQGAGYRVGWGRVWLDGAISTVSGTIGVNAYVATLPEAVRPDTRHIWAVSVGSGKVGYLSLTTDGRLQIIWNTTVWGTAGSWLSLDGLSYVPKVLAAEVDA